ncbi:hypothetical protein BJ742DRAFT_436464 [Cladochytrium replicatum]|nr:hypothetical protein BJ742DRAFT_436464 [Cladochytrium replicatum]
MEKGKILSGFQEASINFPPTFKFDLPVSGELYSPSTASGSSLTTPTSPSATEPISPARGKVAFPDGIPWDGGSYTLRYDTSPKARIPSWTDRVLYKSKRRTHTTPSLSLPTTPQGTRTFEDGLAEALVVENYKACLGVGGSDHVPVVCAFTLYPESSQEEGVVRSSNSVDIREIDTRETSEKDAGLNSARQKRCIIS